MLGPEIMPPRRAKSPLAGGGGGRGGAAAPAPAVPNLFGRPDSIAVVAFGGGRSPKAASASGGAGSSGKKRKGRSAAKDDADEVEEEEDEVEEADDEAMQVDKSAKKSSSGTKKPRVGDASPKPSVPLLFGPGSPNEVVVMATKKSDAPKAPIGRTHSASPVRRQSTGATPGRKPEIYAGLTPGGSSAASSAVKQIEPAPFSYNSSRRTSPQPQASAAPTVVLANRRRTSNVSALPETFVPPPLPAASRQISHSDNSGFNSTFQTAREAVIGITEQHGDHAVVVAVLGVFSFFVVWALTSGGQHKASDARLAPGSGAGAGQGAGVLLGTMSLALVGGLLLVVLGGRGASRAAGSPRSGDVYWNRATDLGAGLLRACWFVWEGVVALGRTAFVKARGQSKLRPGGVAGGGNVGFFGKATSSLSPNYAPSRNTKGNTVSFAPPAAASPRTPAAAAAAAASAAANTPGTGLSTGGRWAPAADRAPTPYAKARIPDSERVGLLGRLSAQAFKWLGLFHASLLVVDALLLSVCAWIRLLYGPNSPWLWLSAAGLVIFHPSIAIWRHRARVAARLTALVEAVADCGKEKLREIAGKDYPSDYLTNDLIDDFKSKKWPAAYRLVETAPGESTDVLKLAKDEFRALLPAALLVIRADSRVTESILDIPRFGGVKTCLKYSDGLIRVPPPVLSYVPKPAVPVQAPAPAPVRRESGGYLSFGR